MSINHDQKPLNECNDKSPLSDELNTDTTPPFCPTDNEPSKNDVSALEWLEEQDEFDAAGRAAMCNPMQTGQIVNDLENPNRDVIYRYSKAIRGTNQAVKELFSNIIVLDTRSRSFRVPIIWGTQENAVVKILQDNVRKDNSLVIDRIKLPMLAIYASTYQPNLNRYTYSKAVNYFRGSDGKPGITFQEGRHAKDTIFGLTRGIPIDVGYSLFAWTSHLADMDQIVQQVVTKFDFLAYIRVQGVPWQTIVRLDGIDNNLTPEPGDQKLRVIKFQFNLTAETYIPQPIVRKKAVLKERIGIFNMDQTEVLARLEEAVKEFEE